MPSRLTTKRLLLDEVTIADIDSVTVLASDRDVARGTLGIPHPYSRDEAESWIRKIPLDEQSGASITWAIRMPEKMNLIGCVTLFFMPRHKRAEIGFWLGRPYWGAGFATEAVRSVLDFGFSNLDLRRVDGSHFEWNAASSRVLLKTGFLLEGMRRQFLRRFELFEDLMVYGLLAESFNFNSGHSERPNQAEIVRPDPSPHRP
jgi:ribosomal-protein-alanine N-acetyltransferase